MNYQDSSRSSREDYLAYSDPFAAYAQAGARSAFIMKTYLNLAAAILGFAAVECLLFNMPGKEELLKMMIGSRYSWLIIVGLFVFVSYIANSWALNAVKPSVQYAGLALYVVAEAVIFFPLMYIAYLKDANLIVSATIATGGITAMLTAVVFFTRKDFSFLGPFLGFFGLAAIGLIVVAILFQFSLGPIFTYAMIAFAGAYILYNTSNIMHQYRTTQHAAAALALFASVALLFYYILMLFLSRRE